MPLALGEGVFIDIPVVAGVYCMYVLWAHTRATAEILYCYGYFAHCVAFKPSHGHLRVLGGCT